MKVSSSIALAAILAATAGAARANEPGPWNFGAVGALNLSQSAFSDNWSGGDKGNVNWVASLDASATRQLNPKFNWANKLELAYGQTSTQDTDATGSKTWSSPDKTTDRVFLESLGQFTLGGFVDPYLAGQLESQFSDDRSPIGPIRFNPVKLTESGGIAKIFEETETRVLKSRLGFGFRQSIARQFTDATGDNTESFSTQDGGVEFQTDLKRPLLEERVLYVGRLRAFLPVFYSASGDLEDYDKLALVADPNHEAVADFWKAPDVDFLNTFSSEVTSWLSVNLYVQWVYDKFDAATNVDLMGWDDTDAAVRAARRAAIKSQIDGGIRKGGQFKQTLAIGLSYTFL